ncbi:hypothetical protein VNO80_16009 [Phaseolus coccineus]|uniref:Uncharacterized protein n=1 Tax=Phaseolus coccineus TaxID=3886 RepID=A0AAN9R3H5_PHACN
MLWKGERFAEEEEKRVRNVQTSKPLLRVLLRRDLSLSIILEEQRLISINLAHVSFSQGNFALTVKMYQNFLQKFDTGVGMQKFLASTLQKEKRIADEVVEIIDRYDLQCIAPNVTDKVSYL